MQVLLVFGGRSVEHEVSIQSAANVYQMLYESGHTVLCVGIDYEGQWYVQDSKSFFAQIDGHIVPQIGPKYGEAVWLQREHGVVHLIRKDNHVIFSPEIIFPITHGTYGEDGSLQGFFQQLDIPFVGCDVCASACAMDKDLTKRLFRDAGITVTPWYTVHFKDRKDYPYSRMARELGTKLFIKPTRSGSSVGAGLATDEEEYEKALNLAFRLDNKVLVEKCIIGREIEFAVLGTENIQVSIPGEIRPDTAFYGYKEKYILNTTQLMIPTEIDPAVMEEGRRLAAQAYLTLGCEGLARVDFFLKDDQTWLVNELNTLPGFTSISMYPKLWQSAGKTPQQLIDELLRQGMQRHARQKQQQIRRGG